MSASNVFNCMEIVERALRKINAYSINDSGADPEHVAEALHWLDMVVADLSGTNVLRWLVPSAIEIALEADEPSYSLVNDITGNAPVNGVMFPIAAYLTNGTTDTPVKIISRKEYNELSSKAASGTPDRVYIDRLNEQTVYPYPIPATDDWTLKIDVQSYAPDLTRGRGEAAHGFESAWQLWMVIATAAEIGDGPVLMLAGNRVNAMRTQANGLRERLLAFNNLQQPGQEQPRRTSGWGV